MITLDASAALNLVMKHPVSKPKWNRLVQIVQESHLILVPDLYYSEISNVIWKYHRFEKLPLEECLQLKSQCLTLIDKTIRVEEIIDEAFNLACQEKYSVYDCCYLVCARRHNAPLLTFDKKLAKIAASCKVPIKTI